MAPAALAAALVVALSPAAADRLLASGAALPAAVRVALVVSVDRAAEALPAAERLIAAGASLTVVVEAPAQAPAEAAFALKRALASLRGAVPDAALGVVVAPARVLPLVQHDLAAYADVVVLATADARDVAAVRTQIPSVGVWVAAAFAPVAGEGAEGVRALARTDADAVLVTPDADARIQWLVDATARLNELPPSDASVYTEQVTVVGARRFSVEEIMARHQAQSARQRRLVTTLVATGRLRVTFEAPGFSAPVVIEADSVLFQGQGVSELQQRRIRVNGLDFAGDAVPRLPIIEPERVSTPPLEIAMTRAYRYRLNEAEDEREACSWHDPAGSSPRQCYVIAFEPRDERRSLYRGRAWIDAASFALVRLHAVQTALRGPITSSEQIDEYVALHLASDPRPPASNVWLLRRSDVRQLYEGAGHRTPIRRLLEIDRHDINPPDFAARRADALRSDAVILRDTPEGYRYLKKEAGGQGSEARREVADRATRVRTLVAGVLVDPNISRPLPFAGLNYADFDLLGTGAQLNGFFGGSYGQVAWSVPSVAGTRWQLAGSGVAILARYNDRSFRQGREIYAENVRQRPAHATVAIVRPLSPRVTLRLGYELDYTHLGEADTTAADFAVPASQWAHGGRVEVQAQRAGWTVAAWWNPVRRAGWRRWGVEHDYSPAHHDFQRWGAHAARAILFSRALVGRLEAAWMGGRDLDRFSRYTFGSFDNRLRGYPSASIRYDRGVVGRSALVWHAGPRLRLDGFVDAALVRDPGFGSRDRGYAGVGAAVEMPAPFGLLTGVEWGYGLQGRNTDGSRGTHVMRVTAFKIF
jgi:hypothetical protein